MTTLRDWLPAFSSGLYPLLAAIVAMTLVATLKLSLTRRLSPAPGGRLGIGQILTHPLWLWPLALMVPFVIGSYLTGTLSPWPPAAFAMVEANAGLWPAIVAGLSAATIDLWLFWTAASALISFTQPLATIYDPIPKEMHKFYHLVNVIVGTFVVVKALISGG